MLTRRADRITGILFFALIALFIAAMALSEPFFEWAFARHQNQWSWYLRPIFLIPACYFAYQRSLAGIAVTLFLLLTSMFWFPEPALVDERVREFLAMEKDYLRSVWGLEKILFALLVPISLGALFAAFWRRSIGMGLIVLALIAFAKMLWSVLYGGESGLSIFAPALVGLLLTGAALYLGAKRWTKGRGVGPER